MLSHGYSKSDYDSCVYNKKLQDGSFIYLLPYVNDMFIVSKSMPEVKRS